MKKFRVLFLLVLVTAFLIIIALFFLQTTDNQETSEIRITEKMSTADYNAYFREEHGIILPLGMAWWSEKIGFRIQNCRFTLLPKTSVYGILKSLRENRNQTVNLVIPPGIFEIELIKILERKLFISKEDFYGFLNSSNFGDKYNYNKQNWPALITPNTYNFSVNTDISQFFDRMKKENDLFWTTDRLSKLRNQKLSIQEAVTLASIVQKESLKKEEYGLIAGVYMNRLRINMPLGADPTLVFIRGKGGRVYHKDIQRDSPYNTYKNTGLPPGPICIPSIAAIDAVINYKKHDYLYFCANSDLSGFHVFERHYKNHLINAKKFQRVLNNQAKRK